MHTMWINAKEQREGTKICVCLSYGASSLPSPVALNYFHATTVLHRVLILLFSLQPSLETTHQSYSETK